MFVTFLSADTKAADAKAILNMNHILMSQSMDNSCEWNK